MHMKLVRFDPEPPDSPRKWQVGYDVTLADGRAVHSVTTVFASQIPDTARATILKAARNDVRPGLVALEGTDVAKTQED